MTETPVQITGNLTHDPEVKFLGSGRAAARFSVAVNSRRKNPAGEWVDGESTYFPCTAWGELAEHVGESLTRGARVVVLGRIAARTYTPQQGPNAGIEQTRMEVTADLVAASLQWADVAITKAPRTGAGRDVPWPDEPGQPGNGTGTGDRWGAAAGSVPAGSGAAGFDDEPPF